MNRIIAERDAAVEQATTLRNEITAKDSEFAIRFKEKEEEWKKAYSPKGQPDALDVILEPTRGKNSMQYLIVTNKGEKEELFAQCKVMRDSRQTNGILHTSYDLGWESGESNRWLSANTSGKLVIAEIAEEKEEGAVYLQLVELRGGEEWEHPEFSRWDSNDTPDFNYLLEITVIGLTTQKNKTQQFVLRPGKSCAIEMELAPSAPPIPESISDKAMRLASDLFEFLKAIGPEPNSDFPAGSTQEDKLRIYRETWHPWHDRLFWGYEHKFKQRVTDFAVELRANSISPNFEELRAVSNAKDHLTVIREQAEKLLILSKSIDLG